jgi:hypothetical protein
MPRRFSTRRHASNPIRPSATITRTRGIALISASRCGRQLAISSGVGLLSGGAQRTAAAMYASRNTRPSSARREVGMLAKPARCSAAIRKSPEPPAPSPVNTRPVRLAPCAAGASPTISRRASASPNPGTGRAQYVSSRYARRFSRPTCWQ